MTNAPRILACTVAAYGNQAIPRGVELLADSCARHGMRLNIFGIGEPLVDLMDLKVKRLQRWLSNIRDPVTHILFMDGEDSLVAAGLPEIHEKFLRFGVDIVVAAEDKCWPDTTLASRYPPAPTKFKYLNSGGIYGRFDAILSALAHAESYGAPDDQWCWTKAWLDGKVSLALDHNCQVFQSLKRSEEDMAYGQRILNILTESEPCVFHGNGGADMSRVIKFILGRSYLHLDDPTRAIDPAHHDDSEHIAEAPLPTLAAKLNVRVPARKAPAGFHRALPATKSILKPTIGIVIDDEDPELLIDCLRHARSAYPQAPMFAISEGSGSPGHAEACRCYRVVYRTDPNHLTLLRYGAAWWHRFFSLAAGFNSDYVIKLDADMMMPRRFRSCPPLEVFGALDGSIIHHGIQGFSSTAVKRLIESRICLDPIHMNYLTWAFDETSRTRALHTGLIDPDYLLFSLAKRLGLSYGIWPELTRASSALAKLISKRRP